MLHQVYSQFFKSCEVSPAIAEIIHITEPMAIVAIIPEAVEPEMDLIIKAVTKSVAIVIPETGLLLLPTSPTILEETVAKRNRKVQLIQHLIDLLELLE